MSEDISNRSTISNKIPNIDSLYVYQTRHKAKFTRRLQLGTGYRYRMNKAVVRAGEDEIYTYHRTTVIDGVEHGLTLVTKDARYRAVQKWFNEQAGVIAANKPLLDKFKKAKSTPRELGITYTY